MLTPATRGPSHLPRHHPEFSAQRQKNGPQFLYIERYNATVCIVPRAASISMRKSLRREAVSTVSAKGDVYLWMRNPFERFACMVQLFTRGEDSLSPLTDSIVFEGASNVHWTPVTQLYRDTETVNFLPFDSINKTWAELFPDIPLEHIHPNPTRPQWADIKKQLTQKQLRALTKYYAQDMKIYVDATSKLSR